MDADEREEVVLDDAQVEEEAIGVPGNATDNSASDGIEDEVVRGGNDGGEDESRVGHAASDNGNAFPGARAEAVDGQRGDGQADEERVAEVERGHGSCLHVRGVGSIDGIVV